MTRSGGVPGELAQLRACGLSIRQAKRRFAFVIARAVSTGQGSALDRKRRGLDHGAAHRERAQMRALELEGAGILTGRRVGLAEAKRLSHHA